MKLMLGGVEAVEATDEEVTAFVRAGYAGFDRLFNEWRLLPSRQWPERMPEEIFELAMQVGQRPRVGLSGEIVNLYTPDTQRVKQTALDLINAGKSFEARNVGHAWHVKEV